MNMSDRTNDETLLKIKEAERLISEISKAKSKIKKTGALLRRHLYHTALYCQSN